jgi:LEA14-like dessication related protein
MKISFVLYIFSFVLYLSSCKNIQEVQYNGVKGFKVNSISMEGIDGNLIIGLKNPNNFGFSIYKSEFDVTYSGVYLGKAKLTKRVHIKANAEQEYSFNLKQDFKNANLMDVMKLLNGVAFKNAIEVKGTLNAGKIFIKKKIPVDVKEKINLN